MFSLRRQISPLVILAFVAVLLVVLDQAGSLRQPQDLVRNATVPVERELSRSTEAVREWLFALRHLSTLRRENERLRGELEQLAQVRVRLIELENENRQLRELLAFKRDRPNFLLLVAQVIARERPALVTGGDPNPLVQAVRIDQGRAQGVEPGMPVITARSLVGRVVEAGEQWAVVKLISDESMSVAALDQQSRAAGVVQGTGDGLVMRFIPHDQSVEPGDVIITSGLGGNFPKGLVIGTVQSVRRQDIAPYQEATIVPPVDLTNLEYVFVIRAFTAGDTGEDEE